MLQGAPSAPKPVFGDLGIYDRFAPSFRPAVLAQCVSVDQVLERVGIVSTRCHISGRPAFRKPSTKWSRTDASRSGWELSQWPIVK